jgi:hypothetical protein
MPRCHAAPLTAHYTGGRRPWIDNSLQLSLIEFPHQVLVSLTQVMRNS